MAAPSVWTRFSCRAHLRKPSLPFLRPPFSINRSITQKQAWDKTSVRGCLFHSAGGCKKKKRADFQCKRLAWRRILTDEVIRSNKTALSKTDKSTEAARGWVRLQASRCNLTRFDWLLHQTFSIFPTFPVLPWLLVPGSCTQGLHSGATTCSANAFRASTQASHIRSVQLSPAAGRPHP